MRNLKPNKLAFVALAATILCSIPTEAMFRQILTRMAPAGKRLVPAGRRFFNRLVYRGLPGVSSGKQFFSGIVRPKFTNIPSCRRASFIDDPMFPTEEKAMAQREEVEMVRMANIPPKDLELDFAATCYIDLPGHPYFLVAPEIYGRLENARRLAGTKCRIEAAFYSKLGYQKRTDRLESEADMWDRLARRTVKDFTCD